MKIRMYMDTKQFKQKLMATGSSIKRGSVNIALSEAEDIMAESIEQVPKDTGTLAEAAFVEKGKSALGNTVVRFGYRPDKVNNKSRVTTGEYMIRVHEDMEMKHDNGKSKFLEDPINDYRKKAPNSIGAKIKELIK